MGEGTARVNTDGARPPASGGRRAANVADTMRAVEIPGATPRVRELGEEIGDVRRRLDVLVGELDRRRHEAFDWRRQLRRHAEGLGIAAIAISAGVTAALIYWIHLIRSRSRT